MFLDPYAESFNRGDNIKLGISGQTSPEFNLQRSSYLFSFSFYYTYRLHRNRPLLYSNISLYH